MFRVEYSQRVEDYCVLRGILYWFVHYLNERFNAQIKNLKVWIINSERLVKIASWPSLGAGLVVQNFKADEKRFKVLTFMIRKVFLGFKRNLKFKDSLKYRKLICNQNAQCNSYSIVNLNWLIKNIPILTLKLKLSDKIFSTW